MTAGPDDQDRFRVLFELAPDAYYLNDLDGNFVDGNVAAERLVGYSRHELIGKSFLKPGLLSAGDLAKAAELLAKNGGNEPTGPDELTLHRKDGTKVIVEIRTQPVVMDGRKLVLSVARDITHRKAIEQQLRTATVSLEQGVAQSTAGLNALNARLQAEIAEHQKTHQKIQAIVKATTSHIGKDFFSTFTTEVARELNVAYVLFCEHLDSPLTRVRTLAFWRRDRLVDNVEYDLAGGPCEITAAGEMTFYPSGITALFPDDTDLVDMGAASYCGFPLRNRDGQVIGHLAILDTREMEVNHCESPIVHLFIARAESELERELASIALRQSEGRYRALIEFAPLCIREIDLNGRILSINRSGLQMMGADDLASVRGRHCLEVVHDHDHDRISSLFRRAVAGETVHFDFKTAQHIPDRVVTASFAPITAPDGRVLRILSITLDITERKRAQLALEQIKERLDFALDATSDGVWDWNVVTGEMQFSAQWYRSLGYEPDEIEAHVSSWERMVHPDDLARVRAALRLHFERGTSVFECENRLRTKSGAWRWNLSRGRVVSRDESGEPLRMVGTDSDITDRLRAEEEAQRHRDELAHFARVATAGELATGLTHELNQPLGALAVFADACLTQLRIAPESPSAIAGSLEKIKEQSLRAGAIVHRIRSFVTKNSSTRRPCSVKAMVDDVLALLAMELSDVQTIDVDVPGVLQDVCVDPVQVEQVILNVLKNAAEAMRDGPRDQRRIDIRAIEHDAQFIEVAVRDTGLGMSEEIFAKALDAFYSTKNQGMGVGLAICRTIVESHGGRITLQRNPDRGMTCRFTLPIHEDTTCDQRH